MLHAFNRRAEIADTLLCGADSQRFHLAIKVAAFEAQRFSGAADVALVFLEFVKDVVTLIGGASFL